MAQPSTLQRRYPQDEPGITHARSEQLSSYSIDHILNEQGLKELAMAEAGTRKALKAEHIFTQDDRNRRAYE